MEISMEYEIRRVKMCETDKVYNLMLDVTQGGSAPYYSSSGIEYYRSRVEDYGRIFGAFQGETLVAYAILDFVGVGEDNYGTIIGIPEKEMLRVVLYAGCVVGKQHRGKGLQMRLCEVRENCAISFGCLHMFASSHSENTYSRYNLINSGFTVVIPNIEFSWGVRDILYKRLKD